MLLYYVFWMFMGFIIHFYIPSKKARALQREKKNPLISLAGSVGQTVCGRLAGYEIEPSHRQFYFSPDLGHSAPLDGLPLLGQNGWQVTKPNSVREIN